MGKSKQLNGMSQEYLNAIKERVAKATTGPWDINRNSDDDVFVTDIWFDGEDGGHVEIHGDTVASSIYNAEFIAHAREDVPMLIEEIEKLREALSFYAEDENYFYHADTSCEVLTDRGYVANQALAGESNEG